MIELNGMNMSHDIWMMTHWKITVFMSHFQNWRNYSKNNAISLYDNEKDRISNIKAYQPTCEHPKWSDNFEQKMKIIIMENPMQRISAERWMVDHITQKNVYKKWRKQKKQEVSEFIANMDGVGCILKNLKVIMSSKKVDQLPLLSNLLYQLTEFSSRVKLNEQDIYSDLRDHACCR